MRAARSSAHSAGTNHLTFSPPRASTSCRPCTGWKDRSRDRIAYPHRDRLADRRVDPGEHRRRAVGPVHGRSPPAPDRDSFGPQTEEGFEEAIDQLREYFDGARTTFTVPLAPVGTEFQHTVWTALRAIEFGTTSTYGEVAAAIGRPTAVRAVAAANARNPLSIVVPCHRVIGSSGRLTGYAGGVERKQFLLEQEARIAHAPTPA